MALLMGAALAAVWSAAARADETCDTLKRIIAAQLAGDRAALADADGRGCILFRGMECELRVNKTSADGAVTASDYACRTGSTAEATAIAAVKRLRASVAACQADTSPFMFIRVASDFEPDRPQKYFAEVGVTYMVQK
jgi:hypothetical protein